MSRSKALELFKGPVEWKKTGGDDEDLCAVVGDYTLRAEKMGRGYWWWMVYFKDAEVVFERSNARTKLEAVLLAEVTAMRHAIAALTNEFNKLKKEDA